ncbi:MAG: hypothetical protein ACI4ES_06785 [Roseburia sp.]
MKTAEDYFFNLDELDLAGVIECPYCGRGKSYSYGTKGMQSSKCDVCKRLVLWDYDKMLGYKVRARKYAS